MGRLELVGGKQRTYQEEGTAKQGPALVGGKMLGKPDAEIECSVEGRCAEGHGEARRGDTISRLWRDRQRVPKEEGSSRLNEKEGGRQGLRLDSVGEAS